MPSTPTILHNGRIHLDPHSPDTVKTLLIQNGHVQAHGSAEDVEGSGAKPVDLGGKTVIPGLIDAHIHLAKYARRLSMVDCEQPTSAACLDLINLKASDAPKDSWILGHGWNQNTWGDFGTLSELDAAA